MRADIGAAAACDDVVQIYPTADGAVMAVRGITASFQRGTLTAVVGPSGAGKSTFLRLLACLERPAAGNVIIDGVPTAQLSGRARRRLIARSIGYVFQRPTMNLLDYLDVRGHIGLALQMRTAARPRSAIAELLEGAGLSAMEHERPGGLGAGEQARLAFAMAVAGGPALVVADEPTAELDPDGGASVGALIRSLAERGQTFVVSTHDPTLVSAADRVLHIDGGALMST